MKTTYLIVTLAAILIFTSALKSQEKPNVEANYTKLSELQEHSLAEVAANPDTVIVNINDRHKVVVVERDSQGRTKEIVYYKKNRSSWTSRCNILFELGFNNYSEKNHFTGSRDKTNIGYNDLHTSKSMNIALYPIFRTFRITKNNLLNIQTGLGIDWGNYRFEDGWTIARQNGITVPSDKYRPNGENLLSKSKLTTVYLNVPFLLKLNIPVSGSSRNHFYLSAGIIGGIKIGSHTKIKYEDGGKKEKDRGSFNLNLLRYDLTFRAGYKWIGIYFNYQMTPMFENGKAHKLFPYSVGLSFKI
ncbi:MAG: outer membrane beta-barrel protein [Prevotellaceae bacterium]|jgi:uncharacterized protein YlzI (FlbEa/FlbD family)|nr:outer membrane beta-barrel protein [Prevotellaceae bacterium]